MAAQEQEQGQEVCRPEMQEQERVGQEWPQEQGLGHGYLGRLLGRAWPCLGPWVHAPL